MASKQQKFMQKFLFDGRVQDGDDKFHDSRFVGGDCGLHAGDPEFHGGDRGSEGGGFQFVDQGGDVGLHGDDGGAHGAGIGGHREDEQKLAGEVNEGAGTEVEDSFGGSADLPPSSQTSCDSDCVVVGVTLPRSPLSGAVDGVRSTPAAPMRVTRAKSRCLLAMRENAKCNTDVVDVQKESLTEKKSAGMQRIYDQNRHWQDSWAARLPWAESVFNTGGRVVQVRCKVCSEVEGREKLLIPKIDSLWKHAGRRKAVTNMGRVKQGEYFFLTNTQHVRNERVYFARQSAGKESVVHMVAQGAVKERKRKLVQFRTVFWLLRQGRPMVDFSKHRELLEQLQTPDCPRNHWSDSAGWEMADSIAHVLAERTKKVFKQSRFLSLSADEVTSVDGQSWLSIHGYVCSGFERVSVLLALLRLVEGNTASAIKEAICTMCHWHTGLSQDEVASRLVCFGADGVAVFQGSKTGVGVQLKEYMAPFVLVVHCFAHRTNLAVEPLSNLPIVSKLESLCQAMYAYFSHSSKRHLEFQKLADVVETEGLSMLSNVKTRWISLLDPLRRVLGEYKTLIVKMCQDAAVKEPEMTARQQAARESAKQNYELLCDVGTLLALPCLLPLLESVDSLIRFAQSNHVFVSDYVAAVKICQGELYRLYEDSDSAFQRLDFQMYRDVVDNHSHAITQEWVTDLNTGAEFLAFRIDGHSYSAHSICSVSGSKLPVSRADLQKIISSVQEQCCEASSQLRADLDRRFPNCDLMNALSVVFPQFWLQANCDQLFPLHMATIKQQYCVVRMVNYGSTSEPDMRQVDPLLDGRTLSLQTSLFKLTMKSNAKVAMAEPRDVNPVTKLWRNVGQNALMLNRLSEFIKLAEIAITAVMGSVEDERTFSTLAFMKSKVRNRLGGHLDTCVKVFAQQFYSQVTFPYQDAITHWREEKMRRGVDL